MEDDLIALQRRNADPLQEFQKTRWQKVQDKAILIAFLAVSFTIIHACDGGGVSDCQRAEAVQISECD